MSVLDISIDLSQIWFAFSGQNSYLANQTSYASCTEGATTEAEDEDLVTGYVVGCNEEIALANDFFKTLA